MLTKTIKCLNCGVDGEIEVYGLNSEIPSSKVFKHLGHNPYSGDMHYQCPSCEIVLLVSPIAVLGGGMLSGDFRQRSREAMGRAERMNLAM